MFYNLRACLVTIGKNNIPYLSPYKNKNNLLSVKCSMTPNTQVLIDWTCKNCTVGRGAQWVGIHAIRSMWWVLQFLALLHTFVKGMLEEIWLNKDKWTMLSFCNATSTGPYVWFRGRRCLCFNANRKKELAQAYGVEPARHKGKKKKRGKSLKKSSLSLWNCAQFVITYFIHFYLDNLIETGSLIYKRDL